MKYFEPYIVLLTTTKIEQVTPWPTLPSNWYIRSHFTPTWNS